MKVFVRGIRPVSRWRNGGELGPKAREPKAINRGSSPERPTRAEGEQAQRVPIIGQDNGVCKIVGFIPLSRSSNSGVTVYRDAA